MQGWRQLFAGLSLNYILMTVLHIQFYILNISNITKSHALFMLSCWLQTSQGRRTHIFFIHIVFINIFYTSVNSAFYRRIKFRRKNHQESINYTRFLFWVSDCVVLLGETCQPRICGTPIPLCQQAYMIRFTIQNMECLSRLKITLLDKDPSWFSVETNLKLCIFLIAGWYTFYFYKVYIFYILQWRKTIMPIVRRCLSKDALFAKLHEFIHSSYLKKISELAGGSAAFVYARITLLSWYVWLSFYSVEKGSDVRFV